jgi:hypothetical protein
MPRSITRPQTGNIVWYFATATGAQPNAALVVGVVDRTHFNLAVFSPVDGTMTFAGNVVLYDGSVRPATAFCTWMRINQFVSGTSPFSEAMDVETHAMTAEQADEHIEMLAQKQQEQDAERAKEAKALSAQLGHSSDASKDNGNGDDDDDDGGDDHEDTRTVPRHRAAPPRRGAHR